MSRGERGRGDDWAYRMWKSCVRKVAHDSHDAAQRAAGRVNHGQSRRHRVQAYHCPICGKWHVGRAVRRSIDPKRKRSRRRRYDADDD